MPMRSFIRPFSHPFSRLAPLCLGALLASSAALAQQAAAPTDTQAHLPVQQTSGGEARQDNPWRTDGVQIDGAQQPLLACQIEDALGVSVGGHDRQMFRLFFQYSI